MRALFMDTSTERGFVALVLGEEGLFFKELPSGANQSRFLIPTLEDICARFPEPIDYIGVGVGPGSYTGIRLGVAAAQSLAYAWKIPLVPVVSLRSFCPSIDDIPFAVVLDARIAGIYLQKGRKVGNAVFFEEEPEVCSWECIEEKLKGIDHLVSPFVATIQEKFAKKIPHRSWTWEEKSPILSLFYAQVKKEMEQKKEVILPATVPIFYLRETEAEREKRAKSVFSN